MNRRAIIIPIFFFLVSSCLGDEPILNDEETVRTALESTAGHLQFGQAEAALTALQPVEKLEPENPWLWFYKGRAHQQLGRPYDAMHDYDHATSILSDLGNPDAELAAAIRKQHHEARKQVFTINLQTGLAYDTNVTYIGGSVGGNQISGHRDSKFSSGFRVDYAPVVNENETLAFGVRLGHTWNFSIHEFNYQDYGAYARYSHMLGKNWEVGLQYDYDFTMLDNDPFLSDHAVTPSLTYHWTPSSDRFRADKTTFYYRWDSQDFLFPTSRNFDRDGNVHATGFDQTFKFQPLAGKAWTWDFSTGYRFDYVATEGREFDRMDHDFYIGAGVPLVNPCNVDQYLIIPDKELMFRFNVQWEMGNYRRNSLLDSDGNERFDLITTYNWSISQTLMQSPEFGDLILHGIISWTDSESNVTTTRNFNRYPFKRSNPFTYDKFVYGVQLEWSW